MSGKLSSLLANRVQVLSRMQSFSAREVIKPQAKREPSGFPSLVLSVLIFHSLEPSGTHSVPPFAFAADTIQTLAECVVYWRFANAFSCGSKTFFCLYLSIVEY